MQVRRRGRQLALTAAVLTCVSAATADTAVPDRDKRDLAGGDGMQGAVYEADWARMYALPAAARQGG